MKKFLVLDTFRFVGAILVALGHFLLSKGIVNVMPNSFVLVVEFFFVLSTFLITLKQEINYEIKCCLYLRKLFWNRIVRLLLPYTIIIIFYYSIVFKNLYPEISVSLYKYFINIFLLQGLGLNNDFAFTVRVAWFLGIELYIGTFFLTVICSFRKKNKELIPYICLVFFTISLSILQQYSPNFLYIHLDELGIIPFGIFRGILSYSVGVIAAIIYKKIEKINFNYKVFVFSLAEFLIIFVIFRFYGKLNYNRENEFIFPIIAGTMIVIFANELGYFSFILKRFSFLGKLGYSIYLIHPIFLEIFFKYKIKNIYLYLLLTLFSSILFYYFIERRIIKLKYNMVYLKIRNQ